MPRTAASATHPAIALPGAMRYQEGGVALAANVGSSEEFVSLRDYRHGDPLRHIHWRSWAKTGRPIVKEFEDEFFVRHALVLDTFDEEPNSEVLEEYRAAAAQFIHAAVITRLAQRWQDRRVKQAAGRLVQPPRLLELVRWVRGK